MNFMSYVFEKSKNLDDKIAIFHKNDILTYSNLYSLVRKIIAELDFLGLESDEKIILVSDNSFFFIAAYFGIIATGPKFDPPIAHVWAKARNDSNAY